MIDLKYEDYMAKVQAKSESILQEFREQVEGNFEKIYENDVIVNNAVRVCRDYNDNGVLGLKYAVVELSKFLTSERRRLEEVLKASPAIILPVIKDGE